MNPRNRMKHLDREHLYNYLARDPIKDIVIAKFPNFERTLRGDKYDIERTTMEKIALDQELNQILSYLERIRSAFLRESSQAESENNSGETDDLSPRQQPIERLRFFNKPKARADFDHWSKAAYWTLEEGVALVLGRSPDIVDWHSVERYMGESPFAKRFKLLRDLAMRAKEVRVINDWITPTDFLAWARRMDVEIPEKLAAKVEAVGEQIQDWRYLHDRLKERYNEDVEKLQSLVKKANDDALESQEMLQQYSAALENERSRAVRLEELAWEGFDPEQDVYPFELDVAIQAWRAATRSEARARTPKQRIESWLTENYPGLKAEQMDRIAKVCNWQKTGGRPRAEE